MSEVSCFQAPASLRASPTPRLPRRPGSFPRRENLLPLAGKLIFSVALAFSLGSYCPLEAADSPASVVRPLIGTDEHAHTFPGACLPFGMVQLSPDTRDKTWDGASGYHYSDTSILGFSHNHLSGTGVGDLGNFLFLPASGPLGPRPKDGYRARFSHAEESASPGYYRVRLNESGIVAELTASTRAGFHRYTFPAAGEAHVFVDLTHGITNTVHQAGLSVEGDRTLTGWRRAKGRGGERTYYFVAEFSRPFASFAVQADGPLIANHREDRGEIVRGRLGFSLPEGGQILVKVGLSEQLAQPRGTDCRWRTRPANGSDAQHPLGVAARRSSADCLHPVVFAKSPRVQLLPALPYLPPLVPSFTL